MIGWHIDGTEEGEDVGIARLDLGHCGRVKKFVANVPCWGER